MKVRRWKGNLVITLPLLDEPRRSKSGRSLLIASSFGVRKSKLKRHGQNLLYVANVFYYPEAEPSPVSGKTKKRDKQRAAAPRKVRRRKKDWVAYAASHTRSGKR